MADKTKSTRRATIRAAALFALLRLAFFSRHGVGGGPLKAAACKTSLNHGVLSSPRINSNGDEESANRDRGKTSRTSWAVRAPIP